MKKTALLLAVFILSVILWSCGSDTPKKENSEEKVEATKNEKIDARSMTVELYSKIISAQRKLLMEKYWAEFKGKEYIEIKDLYSEYLKEEDAILEKYNIEDELVLSSFFRSHYSEVEAYRKSDSEIIVYPEYPEAKKLIGEFAMAKYAEK